MGWVTPTACTKGDRASTDARPPLTESIRVFYFSFALLLTLVPKEKIVLLTKGRIVV